MKKFISIILSIGLTIIISITIFLFCTNSFLKASSIKKIVNNIEESTFREDIELLNKVDNELTEAANKTGLTKEIIAIGASKIGQYIQTGKEEQFITEEEYQNLIEKYLDDILKETGNNKTDVEKKKIKKELENRYEDIKQNMPEIKEISEGKEASYIKYIQNICSKKNRYTFLTLTCIILLLIILLQRKKWNFILYISISGIISSIITLGTSSLMMIIIREMIKEADSIKSIIEIFLVSYNSKIQIISFTLLTLSILSISLLMIIRKKLKK